MKCTLFILAVLSLASCTRQEHVWCNCIGGGQNKSFDYGMQHKPTVAANQARCDTDGVHSGYDTCYVQIIKQ